MINTRITERWESFIRAQVESGRFASEDEVLEEALSLLKRREDAENGRTVEGIGRGLDDMRAGRTQPLDEAVAEIRRVLDLPSNP